MARRVLRRVVRRVLRSPGAAPLRGAAARVPFSRFHAVASSLFWGDEIIEWRGVRVEVNPGEVHGYYAYFLEYANEEIEKCIEVCQPIRNFADVGANTGLVSLAVARACPGLSSVAFEPDRNVAARFRRNLAFNADLGERVQLVEAAVGEREGWAPFVPSDDPRNVQVGRLAHGETDRGAYPVRVLTLSTFFGQSGSYPDVVKIDVEGQELEVLRGMREMRTKPRVILVETHGFYFDRAAEGFNREVVAELKAAGFSILRLNGRTWRDLHSADELGSRSHLLGVRER